MDVPPALQGGNAFFGHRRNLRLVSHGPGGGLVTHLADHLGRGPDPGEIVFLADFRELRVLGEETVTGMDRFGAGDLGRGDDVGNAQVTLGAGGLAHADRLVGVLDVERIGVGRGMDGERRRRGGKAGTDLLARSSV